MLVWLAGPVVVVLTAKLIWAGLRLVGASGLAALHGALLLDVFSSRSSGDSR